MKLSEDIGKDVVNSGSIKTDKINNLVNNKKIYEMQMCYCSDCEIDIYVSDEVYNDTDSPFFKEDVVVKTVMTVWGMCASKVIDITVHGEKLKIITLKVSDVSTNKYVAIAMLESEFNS